jgi:peptidoglycan/LPS O-acetylase OafA/YrhL
MDTLLRKESAEVDWHDRVRPTRFYRPELDGLRFIAFVLVFCDHSTFKVTDRSAIGDWFSGVASGGCFGVDLFFILSAYLITELLRREKLATGSVDIRGFYLRRILRIWPLYFVFVVFWFLAQSFTSLTKSFPASALLAFLSLTGNWYMAANLTFHSPVGVLWSVSVEEQFYCLWPLAARFVTRTGMITLACLLWVGSSATQFVLFRVGTSFLAVWFNSMVHGGAIAIGILSAVLLKGRTPGIHRYARIAMFLAALPLLGGSSSVFGFARGAVSVRHGMEGMGCGLLGASLLFYAFVGAPQDGLGCCAGSGLVSLGRISYGLYVFHYAVLDVVTYALLRCTGGCTLWAKFAISLPITLALAWASYRWFESPFLKLKRRFTHIRSGPDEEGKQGVRRGNTQIGAGGRPNRPKEPWSLPITRAASRVIRSG